MSCYVCRCDYIWFPCGGSWNGLLCIACKCSQLLGRNLTKQKNKQIFCYFGGLSGLTSGLARAWAQETHMGGKSKGNAGVCEQWAHLGHHRVHAGTRAVKQSRSEVSWIQQCFTTCSLFFLLRSFIYWLLSLLLNRYCNMGNLLKVLTCTDLEQEPNFFLDFESEFLF